MPVKFDDDVKKRLKRIEGQVRGVLKMMEEDEACKDVVSQLAAVRSAVDKTIAYVVATNLEKNILEEKAGKNSSKLVKDAVELFIKSK
ncbi:metal-sensing transcriptional repressor [Gorillibacterium sp. sgz5001074]|uniref:metal-sensing transcriptional repressor n=1 Tax=Gorillibacterium sp. sgz5001074 TaxID=3446695 RepID=UPI003F66E4E6